LNIRNLTSTTTGPLQLKSATNVVTGRRRVEQQEIWNARLDPRRSQPRRFAFVAATTIRDVAKQQPSSAQLASQEYLI